MLPRPALRASTRALLALFSLAALAAPLPAAEMPASFVPPFGQEGMEFSKEAQGGNTLKGWLPEGWVDNSEWAPVSATYERLTDRPDDTAGAVRVKVEKLEGEGLAVLTSYQGERVYEKGKKYRVMGWLRAPESHQISIMIRQLGDPYELYYSGEVNSATQWKPFEFVFQPVADTKAIVMLAIKETGTVDFAGLTVAEGGIGATLLPAFGTEGAAFAHDTANGNKVSGWLPDQWVDNSEWAPVSATYTQLLDGPAGVFSAVRVEVTAIDANEGQLQMTSYGELPKFEPGKSYKLSGWVRSDGALPVLLAIRGPEEPYPVYHESQVATTKEWKPFEFVFKPEKKFEALSFFILRQTGIVDFAGLGLSEVAP